MRGTCIWFQEQRGTDRTKWIRVSCETDDWQEAAAVRRRILDLRDQRTRDGAPGAFSEACDAYLAHAEESSDGLAPSTLADRRGMLGKGGHIREWFGERPLDLIDRKMLRAWWAEVVKRRKRKAGDVPDHWTGPVVGSDAKRNYLNAVSAVFDHADVQPNPVREFRLSKLVRNARTKKARAERADHAHPLQDHELARLIEVSDLYRQEVSVGQGKPRSLNPTERRAREQIYAATVALLDGGLRLGEVLGGLLWSDVELGTGQLNVRRSNSRGQHLGTTKSGRARTVEMSERLKRVLLHWRAVCGYLGEGVVFDLDPANYRRAWRSLMREAQIPSREGRRLKPKDLRDSYASHLLTLGIPLAYISRQLGHAGTSVTEQRYARWVGDASQYRQGPDLTGKVPADLLAGLKAAEDSHSSSHSEGSGS